jgi:hypothetical protein
MKKYFLVIAIFTLTFLMSSPLARASSVNLLPVSRSITAGETFQVKVMVDPLGEKIFTAKVVLTYPADLLKVVVFTFDEQWMPLNQTGLNQINNETGRLIKTGGYPAGLSAQTALGTVTFRALKTGEAVVTVGEDSMVLDSQSANNLIGKGNAVFSLKSAPQTQELQPKKVSDAKPITQNSEGVTIAERFANSDARLPDNVPSPDKAWLYTKLAVLSIIAFALQHYYILIILAIILIYYLFRIIKNIVI